MLIFLSIIQLIADYILHSEMIRYFCFVTVVLAKINVCCTCWCTTEVVAPYWAL